MRNARSRPTDLPVIPALYMAVLAIGAAVHSNPAVLKPVLGLVHTAALALFS